MKRFAILFLCIAVGTAILQAQPSPPPVKGEITLEDIWLRYKYIPEFAPGFRWMQDDNFYSTLETSGGPAIWKNSIRDEERVEKILDLAEVDFGAETSASDINDYEFNNDETKILLTGKGEQIYRRSSKEICFVYDRATKKAHLLHEGAKISNATFSPDNSKVAYTYQNDLYFQDLSTGTSTQVTKDGKYNHIINGSTDWVYEEELSFVKAFEWSPDSRKLSFFRFDESHVKEFVMPMYGNLYPEPHKFKYPKAGEANAVVTVHIFDLDSRKTLTVATGEETDVYFARMKWSPKDGQLAVLKLNRLQNQLDVLVADPKTGKTRVLITEKSDTYIDVESDKWEFMEGSGDMIWVSDQSGHNHIYRYDSNGNLVNQVTKGDFDVMGIMGIDEKAEKIYFMSNEDSPLERHLYTVRLSGKGKKKLTSESGTHSITFSSGYTYFIDSYSNLNTPEKTVLCSSDGKSVKSLVTNDRLAKTVSNLTIQPPEFFSFKTSEDVSLNGWMIKPADFDPAKKYPVLMFVYGGPGSQTVTNEWGSGRPFNYMWYQMLAQRGYLIVSVDNRGTGGRGPAFQKSTYAELGKLETLDQIEAAKYLQKQDYVDGDRIGIWGWSYGGYVTSLCMVKGNGIFKSGIAVAPVTNWRFYDTIYTERYLKTPQGNASGYDENSPINFARDLQGKYLLIHGTADDNVHYQNSLEWVNALVSANKQFDVFFYPNRNHGIFGGNTRYHLYQKMTDFLEENL